MVIFLNYDINKINKYKRGDEMVSQFRNALLNRLMKNLHKLNDHELLNIAAKVDDLVEKMEVQHEFSVRKNA
jgi:hypothetical protein